MKRIEDIAGEILTKANKEFQDPQCFHTEIKIIERLEKGSQTFKIAEEILKVMFKGEQNHGRVIIDYDKSVPEITTIISLKKQN